MNQIQEELDQMMIDNLEKKEKAGRHGQMENPGVSEKDEKEEEVFKKRDSEKGLFSFDINYFLYTILALSICLIVVTPILYIRLK